MSFSDLTAAQKDWLEEDEHLWRRAYEIVARHDNLDVSGVYHTLVNFKRSPGERLRRGLSHGRLRPQHGRTSRS